MTASLRSRARVAALAALLVATCVAAVPWDLIGFVTRSGSALPSALRASIDRRAPGYSAFLEEVRARTRPGEKIAIAAPAGDWNTYAFLYYRACYVLAGREVIPWIDPAHELRRDAHEADRMTLRNDPRTWRDADVIAAFELEVPQGNVVWRGARGALLRK